MESLIRNREDRRGRRKAVHGVWSSRRSRHPFRADHSRQYGIAGDAFPGIYERDIASEPEQAGVDRPDRSGHVGIRDAADKTCAALRTADAALRPVADTAFPISSMLMFPRKIIRSA
jgi:hypothetical protein